MRMLLFLIGFTVSFVASLVVMNFLKTILEFEDDERMAMQNRGELTDIDN